MICEGCNLKPAIIISEVFTGRGKDPVLDIYSEAAEKCDGEACAILGTLTMRKETGQSLDSYIERELLNRTEGR